MGTVNFNFFLMIYWAKSTTDKPGTLANMDHVQLMKNINCLDLSVFINMATYYGCVYTSWLTIDRSLNGTVWTFCSSCIILRGGKKLSPESVWASKCEYLCFNLLCWSLLYTTKNSYISLYPYSVKYKINLLITNNKKSPHSSHWTATWCCSPLCKALCAVCSTFKWTLKHFI